MYDEAHEYAVETGMADGEAILAKQPVKMLELLCNACQQSDHDAALSELLAPIFNGTSPALVELRRSLLTDDYEPLFKLAQKAMRK